MRAVAFAIGTLIGLALAAVVANAQTPVLPPKSLPPSVPPQPSPQQQSYAVPAPQTYRSREYFSVPIVREQRYAIDTEVRTQTIPMGEYAVNGGSYSSGFSGGFSGGFAYEAPVTYEAPVSYGIGVGGCVGGLCAPRRAGLFGGGARASRYDGRTVGGTMYGRKNKVVYRPRGGLFGRN